MSKNDILTRFKAKDYNNLLEEILEKKEFSNDVKNLLLNMLYKVETGYNDYKAVKIDVLDKKIIIKEIVQAINENCSIIKLVNPKESIHSKNKKFKIDYDENAITLYPREKDLLRAVYNLSFQEIRINGLAEIIKDSFSKFMNIGYSNDLYEIIRDFDGWNWVTSPEELSNCEYNLIYQNLKILTNNEYLYAIVSEQDGIIDFNKETRNILKDSRIELKSINEFMKYLYKSILVLNKNRQEDLDRIIKIREKSKRNLIQIKNKEEIIEEFILEQKKCRYKIKKIEGILNDPQQLNLEFKRRNTILKEKEKIFSISNLTEILINERKKIEVRLEKILKNLDKLQYTDNEEKIKETIEFIDIFEGELNKEKSLINLQKAFLKCFMKFINKAENKIQIIELIYTFRYYCLLNYNEEYQIKDIKYLKDYLMDVRINLINKSIQKRMFNELSIDNELNVAILEPIFELRNIELKELEIMLTEDIVRNNKIIIEYLDNGIAVLTKDLQIDTIRNVKGLKFNKRIKLFA